MHSPILPVFTAKRYFSSLPNVTYMTSSHVTLGLQWRLGNKARCSRFSDVRPDSVAMINNQLHSYEQLEAIMKWTSNSKKLLLSSLSPRSKTNPSTDRFQYWERYSISDICAGWGLDNTTTVWMNKASQLTAFSRLPAIPVQLMRPGISYNTSCMVGNFA